MANVAHRSVLWSEVDLHPRKALGHLRSPVCVAVALVPSNLGAHAAVR